MCINAPINLITKYKLVYLLPFQVIALSFFNKFLAKQKTINQHV
jgi:hypothetical protein